MGDYAETFKELREHKRRRRKALGINCPKCREVRPKAQPSILLPSQVCRVDGYQDPRPSKLLTEYRNKVHVKE